MIAKNLVHEAILAGHSARFLTAADLILDLTRQETARALQHRLRSYLRPGLLAMEEVGYLAYDAHAADLLLQVVSRRYEQKSIVITTNLPFKQWDTVFPNAACAVGRQRFQQLFFPDGVGFDGNRPVRTGATAPAFSYLRGIETENEGVVDLTIASWNRVVLWMRQLETLRRVS